MTSTAFDRLCVYYDAFNLSGRLYSHVLSQEALINRTNRHLATPKGVVYRPCDESGDTRGLPASTVIDLKTAFWQGATTRAGAQRTHSAIGLSMLADATQMMGSPGMARWGNHPLAVTLRASLPLRVAAWPLTLWNQNLWALAGLGLVDLQVGSGLAEYLIGTGYEDKPSYPQSARSYLVTVPPAFEAFKTDGVLGTPEKLIRQWAWDRRQSAPRLAFAAMVGAAVLRLAKQTCSLSLCAVWSCEILLGGLVGVAHVLANHVVNSLSLALQAAGSRLNLAQPPEHPCTLASFRHDKTDGPKKKDDERRRATPPPRVSPKISSPVHQARVEAEDELTQALLGEPEPPAGGPKREDLASAHHIQEHGQV